MIELALNRERLCHGISDVPCLGGARGGPNPVRRAAIDVCLDLRIIALDADAYETANEKLMLFWPISHMGSPVKVKPRKKTKMNVLCGEAVSAHPRHPFRSAKP